MMSKCKQCLCAWVDRSKDKINTTPQLPVRPIQPHIQNVRGGGVCPWDKAVQQETDESSSSSAVCKPVCETLLPYPL